MQFIIDPAIMSGGYLSPKKRKMVPASYPTIDAVFPGNIGDRLKASLPAQEPEQNSLLNTMFPGFLGDRLAGLINWQLPDKVSSAAVNNASNPKSISGTPQGLGAMAEQAASVPSFHNLFGTGPGAVSSVTTKKDVAGNETTTHKFNVPPIEPIPAAKAIEMAREVQGSSLDAPRQVGLGPQPAFAGPQELIQNPALSSPPAQPGFFGKIGNFLSDPGVFGALGQLGAAIGGPGSLAERLGGFASNQARNRLFDQYVQQRLAGQGGTGQQVPFGLSQLGVGLLSPQEQLAATNQPLTELGALSDAAYKDALISGVETPEQLLNRQLLVTLLGQKDSTPKSGIVQSLNLDPSGKQTSARNKWKWLIDPVTGEKIKPLGPDLEAAPETGTGSDSQERLWYKEAVGEALRQLGQLGVGEIISDSQGNPVGINWNNPERDAHLYNDYLVRAIKKFQALGRIPAGFEKPFEADLRQRAKPKY